MLPDVGDILLSCTCIISLPGNALGASLCTLSFTHHCAGISAKGMYARQKDCIALFEDVIVYIHHKVHLPLKLVYCVYLKFLDGKV